jgi:hypothetical protein
MNDSLNVKLEDAIIDLRELIDVTEPYFALLGLGYDGDAGVSAEFIIEHKDHFETPLLSLSEAGRHTAILGSLALANVNPCKEKHYYLACDAVFDRVHDKLVVADKCKLEAKVISIDKRKGVVECKLYSNEGVLTYEAEVCYAIIHHATFNRKFKHHYVETNYSPSLNPYTHRTTMQMGVSNYKSCVASIDLINVDDCAGHFNNFPALPVARISGAMFEVSGIHYNLIRGLDKDYCIKRVEMHSEAFIFAGNSVKIATHKSLCANREGLVIEANATVSPDFDSNAVTTRCWFY